MAQDQISITCTSNEGNGPFTVNKRYAVEYKGGSTFHFKGDTGFKVSIQLDDNGKGTVFCGHADGYSLVATFKHMVTLKNESL